MSITTNCRCGKKYQVKDENAGKQFKCKSCGASVRIPAGQIDDLEDYECDDIEDYVDDVGEDDLDEFERPVPRQKKRTRFKSRKKRSSVNRTAIIHMIGIISGIIGYLSSAVYIIAGIINLILMFVLASAHRGSIPGNLVVHFVPRVALMSLIGIITFYASRTACSRISTGENDQGVSEIAVFVGIAVIYVPWILYLIAKFLA